MSETTMTPEEEKKLADEAAIQLGTMIEREVTEFSTGLGEDVKVVPRGNTISIKRKNKNFVYIMKGKRVPLSVSVRDNKAWKKLELKTDDGFSSVRQAITNSFNEVASKKE
jgi:hypothetical protein